MNRRSITWLAVAPLALAVGIIWAGSGSAAPSVPTPEASTSTTSAPYNGSVIVGPIASQFLPTSVSYPSIVLVGSSFDVSGQCPQGNSFAGLSGFTGQNPNPEPGQASPLDPSNPMQYNELVTDANGTFTGTLTAPTAPQTVWVETLCDRDGTCSDDFGAPGSPFRCEYYPLATMRRIDFVTELPTTTTTVTTTPSQIPPTL